MVHAHNLGARQLSITLLVPDSVSLFEDGCLVIMIFFRGPLLCADRAGKEELEEDDASSVFSSSIFSNSSTSSESLDGSESSDGAVEVVEELAFAFCDSPFLCGRIFFLPTHVLRVRLRASWSCVGPQEP
mmetsp:Transcript_32786/g.65802  ORF Transcript_32786/g.65802 Transcript_32786/m.65802 type:complete len:130 (+) Transcript_32786:326-715(+)